MTYEDLLGRIISDGIAEVREAYADLKDHHKRDGAVEGFEACRGKTPSELVELWSDAEKQAHAASKRLKHQNIEHALKDYWKQRYKALQIEFILNVISVGLTQDGQLPLLGHLPTASGALKYAEIVGVRESLR